MAYTRPRDLDGFMVHLLKAETRFRQTLGTDLINYLSDPENSVECEDIGLFIDGVIPWIQSSNYKVSSNGIEVLTFLIDRLGTDFRPYTQTVLPNVIDRLGDAKDAVREKSQLLISKLLERKVLNPQHLIEKLQPSFTHKNAKIREEVLRCLVNTINGHGAHSVTLNKFIPDVVNLLSDPTATVRDTAFNTLVELYKHVGEKLRADLQKKNIVPQSKWPILSAKFDEARSRDELLPSSSKGIDLNFDEPEKAVMAKPLVSKKPLFGKTRNASNVNSDETDKAVMAKPLVPMKPPLGSAKSKSANNAGGMDEEFFIQSFEDCPTIQLFSSREVAEHLKNIQDIISDSNKEWNKRVDALKKIRSLVIAGATNYEEFHIGLKNIQIPLEDTLKDLRSQVVREACITISYLSQTLGNKFEKIAEYVLQQLINLIQNSAKVMATSGLITVKFIIQNIHSSRLISIICSNSVKSKSKDIRRACCEFLEMILTQWPKHPLERHVPALQEAVKNGVADADPEARQISRKAFKGFREHFPDQAEILLQSLDPSYRRVLQGEGMSASSSHHNLNSAYKSTRVYSRPLPSSTSGTIKKGFRSNSAIDLQAAQRAKARAQYSAAARTKIQSGTASLPRPKKPLLTASTNERVGRPRSRNSQSQPTSRSGSPSSRLAYIYHRPSDVDSPRTRPSGSIPRSVQNSRDTSRETSPTRGLNRYRRASDRPPLSPASRPVLAQKILQQSREAENALADVFNNSSSDSYRSPRKNMRSVDNQSDESETSSVCSERSERSYDSFRRSFDSYSWSGSQQRLSRDIWEPARDINQILALCAATNWQERKDGLLSLQKYLASETPLSPGELKYLTEIFTRMFMDSHTKGLSVFLDTLHDVIKSYKGELEYWLYVLLVRVFLKIGTETLTSIQGKLLSTLELIKISFPVGLLIANVYRFLIDATQTPNTKVKNIVLNTLSSLSNIPEAAQYISEPPASQALLKIISYAQDPKSAETRHAARQCIVTLWNCNTAQVTMMLAELPKELQDLASNVVHSHMRKSSTGSEPGSPMPMGSPKPLSPGLSPPRDGLDQEEFHRRLRRTTAEIQNYSYETLGTKLDKDRVTTSQDSGISQMSAGNDEQKEDVAVRLFNVRSGPRSLPDAAVNGISEPDTNGFRSLGIFKDSEKMIAGIIEDCSAAATVEEKRRVLNQLSEFIKLGQLEQIQKKFRNILRILINNISENDADLQVTALQTLRVILQTPELKESWSTFVELLIVTVLQAYKDEKRDVAKQAELTASALVFCPFETIVSILSPLIRTNPYPELLGTIKMLSKSIEAHPNEVTEEHLAWIMPGLIKGSDHSESSVRKSSIFCMVVLHHAVGEERLASYITNLSVSKVKLLKLYIERSGNEKSVPTSPRNNGTS